MEMVDGSRHGVEGHAPLGDEQVFVVIASLFVVDGGHHWFVLVVPVAQFVIQRLSEGLQQKLVLGVVNIADKCVNVVDGVAGEAEAQFLDCCDYHNFYLFTFLPFYL